MASPIRPPMPNRYSDLSEGTIATEGEIQQAIRRIAERIANDYKGKLSPGNPLVLVGVLKGVYLFMADLQRALDDLGVPTVAEFICVSSYGGGIKSTGEVRVLLDARISLAERHVILVEDLVDTGRTLDVLSKMYRARSPASLKTVALLDKFEARKIPFDVDYVGIKCPNAFVIGYGLDYQELFRGLRDIIVLKKEVYSSKI